MVAELQIPYRLAQEVENPEAANQFKAVASTLVDILQTGGFIGNSELLVKPVLETDANIVRRRLEEETLSESGHVSLRKSDGVIEVPATEIYMVAGSVDSLIGFLPSRFHQKRKNLHWREIPNIVLPNTLDAVQSTGLLPHKELALNLPSNYSTPNRKTESPRVNDLIFAYQAAVNEFSRRLEANKLPPITSYAARHTEWKKFRDFVIEKVEAQKVKDKGQIHNGGQNGQPLSHSDTL